ncbi:hypothetical protein NUW58_g4218 [Xylaria curta]|uniref:Uncharacterized protein n=1 Tax=Xylaria curta TaxID=42375 RepID=A0ACC1P8V6_9PEZI|nr:hypothetical protein NUW58_g4218 [Xylaria curta]
MVPTPVLTERRETVDAHAKSIAINPACVQTGEARRSIQGLFGRRMLPIATPATRLGRRRRHDFETEDTTEDERQQQRGFKGKRFLENRFAALRHAQLPQTPNNLNFGDIAGHGVRGESARSIQVLPTPQKESSDSNPVRLSSKRAGRLFETSLQESPVEGQEIQKEGNIRLSEELLRPGDTATAIPASEAPLFISVLGLRSNDENKRTTGRYANIFWDMPEMSSWMRLMASKGHRVWLAGGGLAALRSRICSPLRYWREGNGNNTIRLWIVVTALAADEELAWRRHSKPSVYYALTKDGDVVWSHTP